MRQRIGGSLVNLGTMTDKELEQLLSHVSRRRDTVTSEVRKIETERRNRVLKASA